MLDLLRINLLYFCAIVGMDLANELQRIGEPIKPTGPTSVRFVRKVHLEGGAVIWEFKRVE